MGVCKQITLLIPYCLSSSLVTLINPLNAELNPICHLLALLGGATIVVVSRLRVKVTDAPIQVPDTFDLTTSFKLINFSFPIFLRLVHEMFTSFASYSFTLFALVWIL